MLGGHARFQTCTDRSWWTMKPGGNGNGLQVEHSSGKCLCPKDCRAATTGLILKSCDKCACAEGWTLSESTGQLSKPVWGKARAGEPTTESLTCLSRKQDASKAVEGNERRGGFRFPDFAKNKASLKLCYMSEALTNTHALSPTATTTSKGHVEILLSRYYRLAIAAP